MNISERDFRQKVAERVAIRTRELSEENHLLHVKLKELRDKINRLTPRNEIDAEDISSTLIEVIG